MSCSGTQYSYAQLEQLWINAGGSPGYAPLMAAIAEAESGGCSGAVNATDNGGTQTSWGLWQISNGTHSQPSASILTGAGNAAAAVAKMKSQGLSAWGTYDSGAYKQYLNGSVPPDPDVSGTGTDASLTAATTSAGCLIANPFSTSLPLIGNISAGPACIFAKSYARAMIGATLMAAGAGIGITGLLVLAAYGLKASGAARPAGRALEVGGAVASVAGMPEFGVPLAAAGGAVRSQGVSRAATGSATSRGKRQLAARKTAAPKAETSQQA